MHTRVLRPLACFSRRALLATALACGVILTVPVPASVAGEGPGHHRPGQPGGGWDQTARAMQQALEAEKIASGVQVQNIGGAGGTIGLAQFVSSKRRKGDAVLVGGLVMVGAILTNKAPVSLDDVTPLARLTGEYEAIVVPTESPIKSMADLVAKLKATRARSPGAAARRAAPTTSWPG
jgi:putative tricarboxylic transport membrane protein